MQAELFRMRVVRNLGQTQPDTRALMTIGRARGYLDAVPEADPTIKAALVTLSDQLHAADDLIRPAEVVGLLPPTWANPLELSGWLNTRYALEQQLIDDLQVEPVDTADAELMSRL